MAATALLKFTQGATIGDAGEALVVATGASVTIENGGDSTDVHSWRIELLYGPVGSTFEQPPGTPLLIAQSATGNSISGNITPEVSFYGCYRIRLTVYPSESYAGTPDVDIRNLIVPTANASLIIPPYQEDPSPIALSLKPDELNFGGQPFGWAGPAYGSVYGNFRALHAALLALDAVIASDATRLKLDGSNGPMTGALDLGGYNLTNFVTDAGGPVSLTGGASLAPIRTYPTGLGLDEVLRVGCQVDIWETADRSVYGTTVGEVSIRGTGAGITLSRTDFGDVVGLPTDFAASFSTSGTSLVINAKGNSSACRARWKLWHQPKVVQT